MGEKEEPGWAGPGRAQLLSQAPRLGIQKAGNGQASWAGYPETKYPPSIKKRAQPLPLQPAPCMPRASQGLQEAGALGEAPAWRARQLVVSLPNQEGHTVLTCGSHSAVSSAQNPQWPPRACNQRHVLRYLRLVGELQRVPEASAWGKHTGQGGLLPFHQIHIKSHRSP